MSSPIKLLKTKRFLPLFITQFLGAFNDNAFKNAFLIWFTYDVAVRHELNAEMMVTLAAGLFILPFFLFSATAGQVADKFEKSKLTQTIKKIEIVLMVLCGICFYFQSIYGLLVVLFMMGVQSTFFGPIKYSLLPEHLKDDELISGNGLIEGGTFLSILLGTIFGGLIIRTEYGVEVLSLCVIVFSVVGYVASLRIPEAPPKEPELAIGWNIAVESWRIMGFAKKERSVWLSIIGISWFWFIGATFLTQFPIYTKQVIGGNEHIVTLFLTIFSVGIGIGSVWCDKLLKGKIDGRLVPYGSIGITLTIVAFCLSSWLYADDYAQHIIAKSAPDFLMQNSFPFAAVGQMMGVSEFLSVSIYSWFIVISLLALSVTSGIYIVPLYAIMQHRSDENHLARVIAANNMLNALFMVGASLLALLLFSMGLDVIGLFLLVGVLNIPIYFIIRGVVKRRLEHA